MEIPFISQHRLDAFPVWHMAKENWIWLENVTNLLNIGYYWSKSGIFLEIQYNPSASRKSFFGGNKAEGDEGLSDYIEGFAKRYDISHLKSIAF